MLKIQTPKNYLQASDILSQVGNYVAECGQDAFIIAGEKAWQQTGAVIEKSLQAANVKFTVKLISYKCNLEKLTAVADEVNAQKSSVVIGVGGGTIMDCSKVVAELAGPLPVIQVPTIAATCAAWSPFSVLYDDKGAHVKSFPLSRYPEWILVDPKVIVKAPVRFLKAGIIDAAAKWYEFSPYLKTSDDVNLLLQLQVAKLTYDILVEHSDQAIEDYKAGQVTKSLSHTIDATIALAGLANSVRDSAQRTGIAHAIHDSLTHIPDVLKWVHGEKVGYGLAIQAILEYPNPQDRLPLLNWLARLDMPLTPAQLSSAISDETLVEIANRTKIKPNSYKMMPFDISAESILNALRESQSLIDFINKNQ
ncbi:glycerol dehydrogenase [Orbus hercynius]|uniref:Glycerol dehydrogenase n=1 Tax=Orbus hercynius TaxID=593135 RepID=A0A495RFI9_9GAMM|nr:iron-containing alcohol dehydrogenase family protein [Orbus hercynius]RKS85976.1 glycerol dehydrogenase [Orbus hercynius]